ncbi:unknown [Cercopithecine alphaherpesvirus 9]|uniref:Tegument protein UL14 n=1 Tax=Cercopithecine herpesvirus 9 (strain DHV) TaxID=36348 RepID=Q9E1X4_CHV9D|nr:tegument protein UL14 [Cercopithecine alphaherpesvirus 9]AAG27220.1 unknown [Cercopithecine alphaherpesvirus 9]
MSGTTQLSIANRRTRVHLLEAHHRANLYKQRTTDLIRGGSTTSDPHFVHAFTTAKDACAELNRNIRSVARVTAVEQKIAKIQERVKEQTTIRKLLNANRRYLAPNFVERLENIEDDNCEGIDKLEDAVGGDTPLDHQEGWLCEDDEALLTQWMLTTSPSPIPHAPPTQNTLVEECLTCSTMNVQKNDMKNAMTNIHQMT